MTPAANNVSAVLNEQDLISRLVKGDLIVTPILDPQIQIGPTSIDIRLGFEFEVFNTSKHPHLDPLDEKLLEQQLDDYTSKIHVPPLGRFILHPDEFVLASTFEYFVLPSDLAGRLEGRSTWGRLGLQIHSTAGFVDPGFEGVLTFELRNAGKTPLTLLPGTRIAQICFYQTCTTAIPYIKKKNAKYYHMLGTSRSLFYRDPEFARIRKALREEMPDEGSLP
ncbi:MAG: dCTP deaminase [Gemmatimonadota bacterium]